MPRLILPLIVLLCGVISYSATRVVTYDGLWHSTTTPTFDKGYVIAWNEPSLGENSLFGLDGHKLYEIRVSDSNPGPKHIFSAAVDTDGALAVAYEDAQPQGVNRRGIALLDRTGKIIRIIYTGQYQPSNLCFSTDHSIWAIGQEPSKEDFLVFRKFSRKGEQLGAFISRLQLPPWEGLGVDQIVAPMMGMWKLRAAKDRIGAVLTLGSFEREWIELDASGNIMGQWPFNGGTYQPAAFTSDGTLYANIWDGPVVTGVAVLDRLADTWKPIYKSHTGLLLGSEGTDLVFWAIGGS